MKKYSHVLGSVRINYYLNGTNPKLAIHSGTHGDEFHVIDSVTQTIRQYLPKLPDFIFIPSLSPSAVKTKTRNNSEGLDLNRCFYDNTSSPEALAIMDLTRKFPTEICISFHEDPDQNKFYMYDTVGDMKHSIVLENLKNEIQSHGIGLYSGIDDTSDPVLGFEFVEGYKSFNFEECLKTFGTFACWAISEGVVKREIMPEVPGKITKFKKNKLVDVIFRHLINFDGPYDLREFDFLTSNRSQ